jgi:hypothetical protein
MDRGEAAMQAASRQDARSGGTNPERQAAGSQSLPAARTADGAEYGKNTLELILTTLHKVYEERGGQIFLRGLPDVLYHWCQMAEFRAAGPKNGPVKFLAA